jgi:hypothetical protein
MPEYLLLIYEDEHGWENARPETLGEVLAGHQAFSEKHGTSIRGGEALQPTATATCIRHDLDGGVTVTDGAFAETKEAMGGYYLVEAADLDEALRIAKDVPAPFGGIEIRPIRIFT